MNTVILVLSHIAVLVLGFGLGRIFSMKTAPATDDQDEKRRADGWPPE